MKIIRLSIIFTFKLGKTLNFWYDTGDINPNSAELTAEHRA